MDKLDLLLLEKAHEQITIAGVNLKVVGSKYHDHPGPIINHAWQQLQVIKLELEQLLAPF